MTQPTVWNTTTCPAGFRQDTGMTDWNTFLTNINTELVTNRGWTTPSANLYQCPADSAGRWIDVLFTRISATSLEFRLRDHMGRTICTRRIQLDGAGTSINYYTGKFYCVIDSLRATSEVIQAYLAEPSPDRETDMTTFTAFGSALRSTADSSDGNGDQVGDLFGWEDTAAAVRQNRIGPLFQENGGVAVAQVMVSASLINEPVQVTTLIGGLTRWCGNLYQMQMVDSSIALQSDKTLMVDDAASATFRVVGLATANNCRLAVRKP